MTPPSTDPAVSTLASAEAYLWPHPVAGAAPLEWKPLGCAGLRHLAPAWHPKLLLAGGHGCHHPRRPGRWHTRLLRCGFYIPFPRFGAACVSCGLARSSSRNPTTRDLRRGLSRVVGPFQRSGPQRSGSSRGAGAVACGDPTRGTTPSTMFAISSWVQGVLEWLRRWLRCPCTHAALATWRSAPRRAAPPRRCSGAAAAAARVPTAVRPLPGPHPPPPPPAQPVLPQGDGAVADWAAERGQVVAGQRADHGLLPRGHDPHGAGGLQRLETANHQRDSRTTWASGAAGPAAVARATDRRPRRPALPAAAQAEARAEPSSPPFKTPPPTVGRCSPRLPAPQVGFNMRKVTKGAVTIKMWDLGGQPRFRSLWERYCRGVQAIVYVVDAADGGGVEAAARVRARGTGDGGAGAGDNRQARGARAGGRARGSARRATRQAAEAAAAGSKRRTRVPPNGRLSSPPVTQPPPRSSTPCWSAPPWTASPCWCWATRTTCPAPSPRSS